jgi:hypothetical protein
LGWPSFKGLGGMLKQIAPCKCMNKQMKIESFVRSF